MRVERPVDIAVFARPPVAGLAKTRLIPRLGATGAARLQKQLTDLALARARALPGTRVTLWTTGSLDDEHMQATARAAGAAFRVQQGADLGARMAHAFASSLDDNNLMLLIGTDCPAQTVDDLRSAVDALAAADAVVQPAEDGGYVLIGMCRPHPVLFDQIEWGHSTVLAGTRARAREHGLRLAELPACWDLDRSEDLDRATRLGLLRSPS
jgi:rSAM/selenodomain-associated transferase 1